MYYNVPIRCDDLSQLINIHYNTFYYYKIIGIKYMNEETQYRTLGYSLSGYILYFINEVFSFILKSKLQKEPNI